MLVLDKSRVSEETVQIIIELIRSGDFVPGDQLPSERQLARELKVSRTSIREALRRLEAIGLVEIQQGRGTFVKNPSIDVIQSTLIPSLITDSKTIEKLFELRQIIEVESAALAAQRITQRQLEDLQYWLDEMDIQVRRKDWKGAIFADVEFHRLIIVATGNEILVRLIDNLVDLLREMRVSTGMFAELYPHTLADHGQILANLRASDSLAAKVSMQNHLNHVIAITHNNHPDL
jgi:GntR family transcriptional regulator, transcriptional repressor for pyruvate dehydrogenase complex